MAVDPLSDLLKTVHLTGATFFDVTANEPWVVESPVRERLLQKILPGADHLIAYHVITSGRCYAALPGGEALEVNEGEVIVFTHGDAHILSSAPGMRAAPNAPDALDAALGEQMPFCINFAGEGKPAAKFVCGYLACDSKPFNPLLENLPRIMKAGEKKDAWWLSQFIRFAVAESSDRRAGGEGVLAKLSELMFIEVVRRHLETLPTEQSGWLAGLRDPFVGKTLALLHGAPAHNWTIEELAKEVGASRSVLAERFTELVGTPPMHYLAKWRMQIASELLSRGNNNVSNIAAQIGYESEAAFSRAFKKMIGVPPSLWRQRAQSAG